MAGSQFCFQGATLPILLSRGHFMLHAPLCDMLQMFEFALNKQRQTIGNSAIRGSFPNFEINPHGKAYLSTIHQP